MRARILKTVFLSSVFTAPAYAQDAPFESNAIFLGTLAINSTGGDAINDKDVTSDDLDRKNPADLQELFRSEPTISVGSSIPMSQKVYVNGIEETRLGITIDGARQNNKVFHHAATNLIDPALLKSARVDPGVAPADAGPGALAGTIAFETKDVEDLLDPGATAGGRVKLEYDSNGDVGTASSAVYSRQGGFESLLFLKRAEGDTRQDGAGDDITGSGTNLASGLLKLAYETDEGHRFELSYEQVHDDEARPYRGNIQRLIGGRPVPLTRNYVLDRRNVVLTYTDETPEGWWDPKFQLSFAKTELDLPEEDQSTYGRTQSFSGVFQNTFAVASGTVTTGLDFFRDEGEMDYKSSTNPAWNEHPIEKLRNVGVFGQARLEPLGGLRLTFGARADFRELEGVDGSKHDDSGISGNFAAEYDLTDSVTLSGGYSHVWGGIDLAENFIMNAAWTYPSDGFDSITARNAFIAAELRTGAWVFDAKLFQTDIDNARNASYGGGPALTADVETRGYEVGVAYAWANGSVQLGYANIESDVDGRIADSYSGNYLTMPLGEVITLSAVHDFETLGLRIGGDVEHVLKNTRTYSFASGGSGPALPSYTVANAFVEYTPRQMDNLTFRAEVNNIFDEQYAARATYGQDFAGEVVPLYEPGRALRISAAIRF
ncbi:TonB-dependent receptor domain-containing protein [Primorskyibacter flagellatus]|uniref:Hemoglobin/transferrin/lactoferrin receptor protein n=1 Tax=Primorskyibacter flagellatus TaxID=1387277 RepID=A0A1W2CB73_9RHOB|nr:TonB-dependent receptor [Primorskyibacter flagellatus]SMC82224.1 hemoglobin/transferrin/lactoferrin receptor protein [Primorskyibacter flagellatus]